MCKFSYWIVKVQVSNHAPLQETQTLIERKFVSLQSMMAKHPYQFHGQKASQQGLLSLGSSNSTLGNNHDGSQSPLFLVPPPVFLHQKKWYQKSVCCCKVPTALLIMALILLGLGNMTYFLWPKIPTFTFVGTVGDTSLTTINSTRYVPNTHTLIEVLRLLPPFTMR